MSGIYKKIMRGMGYVNLLLCLVVIVSTDSYAQKKEYPEKTIEIIAATPGSVADVWSRAIADELSKMLKVPVIVVNKGGSLSQFIQLSMLKPDGYSLAYFSYASLVGLAISSKPPVDLFKDFVPIGGFGSFSPVVIVEKSSPFTNFEDLIDYAKKNPKKLKCGTGGIHVPDHFVFELVKHYAKADIVMVPFTGSSEVSTALLGKHVDLICASPAGMMGLLKAGRVRALLTVQKLKDFPDVPLFSDRGLGEAGMVTWAGLFGQSAVPKEIQKKLIDAFEKVTENPKLAERIEQMAFTGDYLNPTEMATKLKKDFEKIQTIAKQVGISE